MEYAGYIFTGKSGQYDVSGLSKSGKLQSRSENRNGTLFDRDTFLEEFLGKQHSDRKLSDMEGVWTDYVEYLDSISGATMDIQSRLRYLHKQGQVGN